MGHGADWVAVLKVGRAQDACRWNRGALSADGPSFICRRGAWSWRTFRSEKTENHWRSGSRHRRRPAGLQNRSIGPERVRYRNPDICTWIRNALEFVAKAHRHGSERLRFTTSIAFRTVQPPARL